VPNSFPAGSYTYFLTGEELPVRNAKTVVQPAPPANLGLILATPSITPVAETNRNLTFVENPLGNQASVSKRIAYGMGTIGYYVRLLLIPYPLSAYYGYDTVPDFGWQTGYTYLGLLVVLLLFGLIAYSGWEKNSLGWLFGWWALLGLIAVSNLIFPIAGIIAERLVFGTSLAFCIGLAWLFVKVLKLDSLEDLVKRLKSPNPGIWLLLGILLVWQVLNIQRIRQWKDPITLFTADLEHFPRSSQGHQLLANRLKDAAEKSNNPEEQLKLYAQAFSHYRQSAEIWPDYRESQLQAGNLSLLFQQPQQAKERFLKVLALGPGSGQLYFNLGNAYEQLNQPDSAILAYKAAIRLQPDVVMYYTNLSFLYFKQKEIDSSLQVNRRAIKYIPGTLEPLINMGKTFYQIQNWDSAIVYLERAYPLGKQDRNLVQVLAELHSRLGNFEKARFYREQLAPQLPSPNSIQQR
jgi:tetratricopeptide (TPR) repeat protein